MGSRLSTTGRRGHRVRCPAKGTVTGAADLWQAGGTRAHEGRQRMGRGGQKGRTERGDGAGWIQQRSEAVVLLADVSLLDDRGIG